MLEHRVCPTTLLPLVTLRAEVTGPVVEPVQQQTNAQGGCGCSQGFDRPTQSCYTSGLIIPPFATSPSRSMREAVQKRRFLGRRSVFLCLTGLGGVVVSQEKLLALRGRASLRLGLARLGLEPRAPWDRERQFSSSRAQGSSLAVEWLPGEGASL